MARNSGSVDALSSIDMIQIDQLRRPLDVLSNRTEKFGEIYFSKVDKTSQWCKIQIKHFNDDKNLEKVEMQEIVDHVLNDILDETFWGLPKPQLIISVTGGAKKFELPIRLKTVLKKGLCKAASIKNAWVITGGSNVGVMELVGDSVSDELLTRNMVVLGIATWKAIMHHDHFYNKSWYEYDLDCNVTQSNTVINPNHTHFIFVENQNIKDDFGHEIDFRTKLERKLSNYYESSKIPLILIVVNGGPNTLQTVLNALVEGFPVIILEESKGCADLIVNSIKYLKTQNNQNLDVQQIREIVGSSDMVKVNDEKRAEKLEKILESLLKILENHIENTNLINIFRLDEENKTNDVDIAILQAFIKTQPQEYYKNLKLAMEWNRYDLAKNHILDGTQTFNEEDLQKLFKIALCQNKPNFVTLLIEMEGNLLNLDNRRAYKFLNELYNYQFSRHYEEAKQGLFSRLLIETLNEGELNNADTSNAKDLLKKLAFNYFDESIIPNQLVITTENHPKVNLYDNLFFWALLHNYIDIAKIFWINGNHQIATALIASKVLKSIGNLVPEIKTENEKYSKEFEELAISVLKKCDKETHDEINSIILLQKIKNLNDLCILKIAYFCSCEDFMSEVCVQNTLTRIWLNGIKKRNDEYSFLSVILYYGKFGISLLTFGITAPWFLYKNSNTTMKFKPNENKMLKEVKVQFPNYVLWKEVEDLENVNNDNNEKSSIKVSIKRYFNNLAKYWDAPVVKFTHSFIFFFLFLILFSYLMLFQLNKFISDERQYAYESSFLFPQYLLYVWIILLWIEEINQFFSYDVTVKAHIPYIARIISKIHRVKRNGSEPIHSLSEYIKNAMNYYYADYWNILDALGILFFLIAIILKYTKSDPIAIQIILVIDMLIWYMRFLHYFSIFPTIGPTFEMLKQILNKDLIFFLIVISTFMTAFGVSLQSTAGTEIQGPYELFKAIMDNGYWSIFGQIDVLECVSNNTQCGGNNFQQTSASILQFDYILLILYLVVLLVLTNILIAKFNFTVSDVHIKAKKIWKFSRYRLVLTYATYPIFPPPLNIIIYPFMTVFGNLKYFHQLTKNRTNTYEGISEVIKLQRKCAKILYRNLDDKKTSENQKPISESSKTFKEKSEETIVIKHLLEDNMRTIISLLEHIKDKGVSRTIDHLDGSVKRTLRALDTNEKIEIGDENK